MRGWTIKSRMLAIFALIALSQGIVAFVGLRSFHLSNQDLAEVYQQRLLPVSQLARINDLMHVSIERLTIAVIAREAPQGMQKYIDAVEQNLAAIDNLARDYAQHVTGADAQKRLTEWATERERLVGKGIKPALASLKAQAFDDAEDTLLGVAIKQFAVVQQRFDAIATNELAAANQTYVAADQRSTISRNLTIGAVAVGLGLCLLAALYVTRSITGPLAAMTAAMKRLADSDLDVTIPAADHNDEVGQMAQAMVVFRQNAGEARRLQMAADAANAVKARRQSAMDRHIQEFGTSAAGVMASMARSAEAMRTTATEMSSAAARTRDSAARAAAGAATSTANLGAVAAAAEEMSASINEISRQVSRVGQAVALAMER